MELEPAVRFFVVYLSQLNDLLYLYVCARVVVLVTVTVQTYWIISYSN